MAKSNIFENSKSEIPKSDSRIQRVDFTESDLGARKSHTSKTLKKNDYTIQHVKGG